MTRQDNMRLFVVSHTDRITVLIMEQKNNGQVVVVKDFKQRGFVRRVWDYTVNNVFITSENGYKRLSEGEKTPWPIGVPIQDVYEYNGKELPERINWKQMTNWTPK